MKFTLDHIFGACGLIPVKPIKEGVKFKYSRNPMYEPPDGVKIAIDCTTGEPLKIVITIDTKKVGKQ